MLPEGFRNRATHRVQNIHELETLLKISSCFSGTLDIAEKYSSVNVDLYRTRLDF